MSAFTNIWDVKAVSIEDAAEEAALIGAAQAGDEAATMRLFAAYVAAIRSAVSRYSTSLPVEDARQAAFLGFLEVIRTHDAERSERLAGKLRVRVHDALSEAASAASGGFTVPARTLRRFFGILSRAEGDIVQAAALAPSFEMSEDTFWDVLAAVKADESLDLEVEMNGGADAVSIADEIAAPREIVDAEDRVLVELAFRAVDDFERQVCRMAYGFTDYDNEVPDAEIGHRLGGFGRLKIQRARTRALGKMREALGA
ncbi:hypothetical protein [Micromonospora sp. NPDC023956]|uniref:hypothetical protein n=1 Tax=Micromonospora sp. NPDC023956 TaxID=3155722 RepID=UPI0033C47A73